MKFNQITFNRLYQQIISSLKKTYKRGNNIFTLASPSGQILQVLTELYQLNMLYIQNVQNSFNYAETTSNTNIDFMRNMARVGQYNPSRSTSAVGTISLSIRGGVNISEEINSSKIVFSNRQRLRCTKNNLDYILNLSDDELLFNLSNNNDIILSVIQGEYIDNLVFTGSGEINQSVSIPKPSNIQDIDNFEFKVFVNDQLWTRKLHKYDLLLNEKAYVAYTGFNGGIDIIFGNSDEGMIPELGSIIRVEYLLTNGSDGNLQNTQINEFKFIDQPTNEFGDEINIDNIYDINVIEELSFGTNGDDADFIKRILPYASSNFVLSGPDQYKFFLMRLGLFSIIDVYTTDKSSVSLIKDIYHLAKKNTDLLNTISTADNTSTLKQLVKSNLDEIVLLRKMLLQDGGENIINLVLVPNIELYYGIETDSNYFTIDESLFILSDLDKQRILSYLTKEGIQVISNEVRIIDVVLKKYIINVTTRIYDDATETNVINNIINTISTYFTTQMRRDRIPPSDIIRLLDELNDIDSVDVSFISKDDETYHKEFLVKAAQFKLQNERFPENTEIIMSDGNTYDENRTIGLDPILGDILIEKDQIPIIRGGFTDRYNNYYNTQPGDGIFSSVNVMILPNKTRRKGL
jgi:hypothetical protein